MHDFETVFKAVTVYQAEISYNVKGEKGLLMVLNNKYFLYIIGLLNKANPKFIKYGLHIEKMNISLHNFFFHLNPVP